MTKTKFENLVHAYMCLKIYSIIATLALFILAGVAVYFYQQVKIRDGMIKNHQEVISVYKSQTLIQ